MFYPRFVLLFVCTICVYCGGCLEVKFAKRPHSMQNVSHVLKRVSREFFKRLFRWKVVFMGWLFSVSFFGSTVWPLRNAATLFFNHKSPLLFIRVKFNSNIYIWRNSYIIEYLQLNVEINDKLHTIWNKKISIYLKCVTYIIFVKH